MFGIKIIKESEYNELILIKKEFERRIAVVVADLKKEKKDCASLREQNGNLRMEVNKLQEQNNNYLREVKSLRGFRRDTLEAMGQIDLAGFQISFCTKRCEHCEREQVDCKKYKFGSHEYCAIYPNK